jgi:flagellar protein FlaG
MVEQGNVTPSSQQVAQPELRPLPASHPSPLGSGVGSSPQQQQVVPVAKAIQQASAESVKEPVSVEAAKSLAKELNKNVEFNKFQASVHVDEGSNKLIVRILARDTGRVVRQLPPEGILLLAEKLHNAGPSGILLDELI